MLNADRRRQRGDVYQAMKRSGVAIEEKLRRHDVKCEDGRGEACLART